MSIKTGLLQEITVSALDFVVIVKLRNDDTPYYVTGNITLNGEYVTVIDILTTMQIELLSVELHVDEDKYYAISLAAFSVVKE